MISRRKVLKQLGRATAGWALTREIIRGQGAKIVVAGKTVEIAVASVSPATVRITVGKVPSTGTIVSDISAEGEHQWK